VKKAAGSQETQRHREDNREKKKRREAKASGEA
jgi:hypothetical protein